jgi:hypothetical protein
MDREALMKRINWRKAQKGQSLVEFSLGLVFLLIIVSGLIDLGRLYFTHVALEDAAGENGLADPGTLDAAKDGPGGESLGQHPFPVFMKCLDGKGRHFDASPSSC